MKAIVLKTAGLCSLGVAALGVILPGLPTTPFLLIAAACFARSSPRLHNWLLNTKVFGPLIRNWEENRSMPRKAKVISYAALFLTAIYTAFLVENVYLKGGILVSLIIPVVIIHRIREA